MQKINWCDFSFWGNEKQYVNEALNSTWLSGGVFIEKFEASIKETLNLSNVLAVANGTAALQLAFLGLEIKPGDEVIVPAFGFLAAANVLKLMDATPVFVDVNSEDWCLDGSLVQSKITPRTKAILVIHNYGVVSNMHALQKIAKDNNVFLIEDCAESIFSKYAGQYCGSFGDISTFSFHATKTISTGEGGMVACRDASLYDRLKLIRSHGLRREKKHYWHEYYGNNFRISNVLAAIGLGQFEQFESIIEEKRRVTEKYKQRLSSIPGICCQGFSPGSDPLFWAIAIFLKPEITTIPRDEILLKLAENGIECRPGFYTPDQLDIYKNEILEPNFISNKLSMNIIVLPSFPRLSNGKIDFICDQLEHIISLK